MSLRLFLPLSFILLLMASCTIGDQSSDDTDQLADGDSIEIEVEEIPEAVITLAPELIGTWRLEEMRFGNTPMSIEEIGESTLEFTQKGTMITSAPGLSPEETTFSYRNDIIISDLDDMEQRIDELTQTRLVLISEIDNTEIKRIYTKIVP